MLTQDVLIHTWDLARAVGADDRLDEHLCRLYLERLPADDRLVRSGMFGAPVDVPNAADVQSRLLARLGRDPYGLGDSAHGGTRDRDLGHHH